jgi:hypothetical protein
MLRNWGKGCRDPLLQLRYLAQAVLETLVIIIGKNY